MVKFNFIFSFSMLLFFSINLNAQTYRMNASYYVRSSDDFNDNDRNKVGVLTKGSTFKVLKKKKIGSAEAFQIRITSLSPPSYVKQSTDYWIYKPNDKDFIKMSADDGNVPTQARVVEVPCEECLAAAQQPPPVSAQNADALAAVSRTITTQQNQASGPISAPGSTGPYDAAIKKYSSSESVTYSINHALRNRYGSSQGTCYKSVKRALLAAPKGKKGLIPYHYSDLAALNSKNTLKQFGFINLLETEPYKSQMRSPSKAPKGAVLVYSSGIPCGKAADCGHIEIKTSEPGSPGYVSDYYSRDAVNETPGARRYGTNYKLVGVLIKP